MFSFKQSRGFTIIELLVAVGVTAILVALMLTITINILNGWNRSSGKLSNENQARLILDQLSQDLQGVIMRRDANTWLAVTAQRDQPAGNGDSGLSTGTPFAGAWGGTVKPTAGNGSFEINPSGRQIADYRFGQAGVWLRFFTTPPDNATTDLSDTSAPRAVAYQMIRVRVGTSDQYTYGLFRSEVRPFNAADNNSTFGIGYDLFMDQTASPSYNAGNAGEGNVGNVRRPPGSRILAVNVIDFGVKLYGRSGNAEVELFPIRRNAAGNAVDANGDPATPPTNTPFTFAASSRNPAPAPNITGVGSINYGYPTAAEVMVRILSPEGVRLISALEAGNLARPPEASNDAEHWWLIARQHSDVFTRRIEFRAATL
jgi:prepilin-type N-terminal cleavage/methylation domain-containing protein